MALTLIASSPMIFFVSSTILYSSFEDPSSRKTSTWGRMLKAIAWGNFFSPPGRCAISSSSWVSPFFPAPVTDWYVETTIRRIFQRSCSGLSATTICIVEQLGFATIPLCAKMSARFTSGTTSGTVGSRRNALLLSTTSVPAFTAWGANSLLTVAPAEKSATSMPANDEGVSSRTGTSFFANVTVFPADRAEARRRSSPTGKRCSSRTCVIFLPTRPVAPTTATA